MINIENMIIFSPMQFSKATNETNMVISLELGIA